MAEALGTEATTPAAPVEGAAPAEGAAPVVEPSEWDDLPALEEGVDKFDRKYVEQLRDREAKYRIKARDLSTKVDEFGGLDRVEQAVAFLTDAGTEEGTIKLFIEAGQQLGLGFKELEALFDASDAQTAAAAEASAPQGPSDDDVLTWKEAKELLRKEVLEPQQRAEEQRVIALAQSTVAAALKDVPKEDHQAVLALGQQFIADGDFDPEHITAAVRKGIEAFENAKTRDREAYLQTKLAEMEAVPTATGGSGAPGGEAPPKPKDWEDAKRRGRERIRAAEAAANANR